MTRLETQHLNIGEEISKSGHAEEKGQSREDAKEASEETVDDKHPTRTRTQRKNKCTGKWDDKRRLIDGPSYRRGWSDLRSVLCSVYYVPVICSELLITPRPPPLYFDEIPQTDDSNRENSCKRTRPHELRVQSAMNICLCQLEVNS